MKDFFYSKNAPFISTDYVNNFVNFTYGSSMSGTLNASWVSSTNYNASATYSRINCCRDYYANLKRGGGKPANIQAKNNTSNFIIYPNPNNSQVLYIESNLMLQKNLKIKIMDITGKILMEQPLNNVQDKTEINIGSLVQGIYMIEISNSFENQIQKLIIQ